MPKFRIEKRCPDNYEPDLIYMLVDETFLILCPYFDSPLQIPPSLETLQLASPKTLTTPPQLPTHSLSQDLSS